MAPPLVHRDSRRRKLGIGEAAHGHRDRIRHPVAEVIDRGAALRAEVVDDAVTAVADADELRRLALHGGVRAREARLIAECAARALLACEAMANGDANRLAAHRDRQLTATAGGTTRGRSTHATVL